jgi:hypothetical protein
VQQPSIQSGDQFGLPQIEKNDSFLDVANTQRLVVMVENEDLAVYPHRLIGGSPVSVGASTLDSSAEVSNTS